MVRRSLSETFLLIRCFAAIYRRRCETFSSTNWCKLPGCLSTSSDISCFRSQWMARRAHKWRAAVDLLTAMGLIGPPLAVVAQTKPCVLLLLFLAAAVASLNLGMLLTVER